VIAKHDADSVESLIQDVAHCLAAIDGIAAVVLGGSRARGTAHAESDIDLGIYYHPDRPLDVDALRTLARELDNGGTAATVTAPGEWGAWINGGAWLQIEGHHVDWLYRDLGLVTRTIAQCRAGRHTCDYQPGHPHGFHNHMYMAEVHHCRVLHDPSGALAQGADDHLPTAVAARRDRARWRSSRPSRGVRQNLRASSTQ
jgi:predicted nucleotidyltransferase